MERTTAAIQQTIENLRSPNPQWSKTEPTTPPAAPQAGPTDADLCPVCKGASWVYARSKHIPGDKERMVRCPACTDWLALSRLTPDEQRYTVDDLTDREGDTRDEMMALRFLAKEMLADPFGFLSIWGSKGSGKSLLLCALVAEFCRRSRPAVYFNASEIVTMLSPGDEAGMGGDWKGDMEVCKRKLMDAPTLAIDEMDKIRWTDWQIQHIGEVLEWRHRYAVCRVTLLSMNRPPWEWANADKVEHIASRLQDGRFNRAWKEEARAWLPKCAHGVMELPGLFEVTLPDIRPTLRRYPTKENHPQ